MSNDGPPPLRRMTPDQMRGETPGVGPEVWNNPGLGGDPGGSFGEQMNEMEMPGSNHRPIGPDVFNFHAEDPRVHANGQKTPPQPSRGVSGLAQTPPQPTVAVPVSPSTEGSALLSWWNPKWTPVVVVGGLLAFAWWYNKKS